MVLAFILELRAKAAGDESVTLTIYFAQFKLIVFERPKVLYGGIEKIIECQLPDDPAFD
jgi:hypothetical protein